MDKESFLIDLFKNQYIGDDGAVLENFVVSKDLFCENVHFKREWMSLKEIAIKSMLVNISDAIVMNAKPKYALLGLKLPKNITKEELKELSSGFKEIAKKYNITIIGGDTVSANSIDISITLLSTSTNPIYRKGLKTGDILCYTGEIGNVQEDLEKLLRGEKIDKTSKFFYPILKDKFFYEAAKYIKAAMDISDGLSKDLSRLSKINNVGFEFFKTLSKKELCSGEEYEILFGCSKKDLKKIQTIAKKHKTKITPFAKVINGSYQTICKEHHF